MENVTLLGSWVTEDRPPIKGERKYEDSIKVMDHFITPAVCVFGCIGNLLNLIVLNRKKFRHSSGTKDSAAHIGLTYLAVSDMLFCLSLFPRMLTTSHNSKFESRNFMLYYQMYGTGLITTLMLVSTWIMVTMATMRYLAICFPLRVRALGGATQTKVLYAVVSVMAALINLPSFWQYKLLRMDLGTPCYIIDIGYMDIATPRGQVFLWIRVIIGTFIPAILLIFCNWSLIQALQRSYRMRQQYHVNESASSSKNRITLMLIVLVTVFVLFVFPCELLEFFPEVIRNDYTRTEVFLLVRSISNLLQTVNFAFNFVLYCLINSYFRSAVFELLTCSKLTSRDCDVIYRRTSCRATMSMTRQTSLMIKYAPNSKVAMKNWGQNLDVKPFNESMGNTML